MPESTMSNQNLEQFQLLLKSLVPLKCFIIFNALLLFNGQPLAKDEYFCNAGSSPTCPMSTNTTIFPFVSSPPACGNSESSFFISGSNSEKPTTTRWPNFVNATNILGNPTLGPPYVMGFFNKFPPYVMGNTSKNSTVNLHANISIGKNDTAFGFINLTWSKTLTSETACRSRTPLNQISQYLPQSINLTSFAHSSFQFSPSNIILLFNCTSSSSAPYSLQINSTACSSYLNGCDMLSKESSNCYQYIPDRKELNLTQAMKSFNCENATFFVVPQRSVPVTQWKPGLIELNWSTDNTWMASNLKLCENCLQTNGSCGYNRDDNFQCYYSNYTVLGTNCSANNISKGSNPTVDAGQHPHKGLKPPVDEGRDHDDCRGFKCHTLVIGFGAAGGFAITLSLSLALFCSCKRKKFFMKTSVPCSSPINMSWMKEPSFLLRKQDTISTKEMSYQEIVHATESFAETHMLGDGGFGAVYKGVLADGRKVAVKRLYHDNYQRMKHFYNEIKVLSNLNHPSLVKLYGFCCEDDKELLLVFEYAPHGTVSDHLHNASKPPMSWNLRLDIACETADALSYLHNSVTPPIYHRDVKTTNILLDEGFHAKLADFGLSKFVPLNATHVSTAPQGTPGYLDPDYHQCYQLTDKSDVYSLGVVLMELISAKPAVDMSRERGEINLSTLAVMKIKCGQLEQLVDPTLEMKRNPYVERSIKRVVELAFQCLYAERDERPSMSFVAETLAEIRREHAQNEDGDGPNTYTSTHSTPTTCQSCVSNERPLDSTCFSTGSSNPPSILSSS